MPPLDPQNTGPLRRKRHLMRAIKTTASLRKDDSSLDGTLNPVALPSGEIVSWAAAFPRPGQGTPHRPTEGNHCPAGSPPPPITAKPTG
jgi:hypothetical protein